MPKFQLPKAAWKVTLDGKDLTDKIKPRLISLTIREKRGDEADELDLTLNDSDQLLDIPPRGAKLRVFIGWEAGSGLPLGLVDKGTFTVDEAGWTGPPDIITVRARSADFTDTFRVRRERSFVNATVGAVLAAVASDNGLQPQVDTDLGAKEIPALGYGLKSDAALLKALGRRFDAVATIKAGYLLFAPIGGGKTAKGSGLPLFSIDRSEAGQARYERAQRDQYNGVEAVYHDKGSATRKSVSAGGTSTGPAKKLRRVYASEKSAQHAVAAENTKMERAGAKLSFPLPLGRPDLYPERSGTVTGFKAEINDKKWLISEISHTVDGSGGLTSDLSFESLA
ncbi:phage late control D family protein [Asticcacaulis solisilvae]|uniref:phage late control D family protein n=1 Tax=Asticcacaulis solisilvae TaxID=1217274 RepID=UPI003FD75F00